MNKRIAIAGCGVSGLSCAIRLQQAGYEVEIIADKRFDETTSAVAGAIWFPYEIHPQARANAWSLTTYEVLKDLAEEEGSGVTMTDLRTYFETEEDATWKGALPQGSYAIIPPATLPPGFPMGYEVKVPLCESPVYLAYLFDRFQSEGGTLRIQKISDFDQLLNAYDVVVNCTGLGSQQLLNDSEMYPIFGQLVKAPLQEGIGNTAAEMPVSDDPSETAYVIRRSNCLLLGGNAIKGRTRDQADQSLNEGIIDRCHRLIPELDKPVTYTNHAGLRPGRSSVRLEREGKLVHNYGHGGGGYTVSWGCADEVLQLIQSIT